jgi:hypothetical protein
MPCERATSFDLRSHAHLAADRCLRSASSVIGIETMKQQDATPSWSSLEQVYLIERDAGLLCRILGMYASRGIDVLRADYAYAAQDVMTLKVCVANDLADTAEVLRVLIGKAATLVGVLAAAEQPTAMRRVA